ncbi:hypothetical protein TNCV_1930971 [Trichonephila clavipes]|nr:hypothetical protein TNCV_1930971 [Trichonephila clavipes]
MKTFKILTDAYEDETLSSAHVFEWYKWSSRGRISVEEDEPAERTRSVITDKNIDQIRDMREFLLPLVKRGPDLGSDGSLRHQDNASAHMALSVKQVSDQQTPYYGGTSSFA